MGGCWSLWLERDRGRHRQGHPDRPSVPLAAASIGKSDVVLIEASRQRGLARMRFFETHHMRLYLRDAYLAICSSDILVQREGHSRRQDMVRTTRPGVHAPAARHLSSPHHPASGLQG